MSGLLRERHSVTTKPYPCEWCGQRIEVGTRALNFAGKWDGEFVAGRFHPECEAAWRTMPYGEEFDSRGMKRGLYEPW
jgi:hypothetical protein